MLRAPITVRRAGTRTLADCFDGAINMKRVQVSSSGWSGEMNGPESLSNSAHCPLTAGDNNMSLRTSAQRCLQDEFCTRLHGLSDAREKDIIGQILWSQQMRATEYFSRWIALKESI